MMPESKGPVSPVAELVAVAELGDPAKGLMRPDLAAPAYLQLLIENEQFADAVRFLAHALPRREAVWWAWSCARKALGPNPPPAVVQCLTATEQWIMQPTDENRRMAMQAAERATFETPAGCAGLGAFLSSGSLAPPDLPPNPPGEYMTARAVAGSIMLAAVASEPQNAPEKYRMFLTQGVELTRKLKLWERPGKEE